MQKILRKRFLRIKKKNLEYTNTQVKSYFPYIWLANNC